MAHMLSTHDLAAALADAFGAAIEAVVGSGLTIAVSPAAPGGRGWGTPITASGDLAGTVTAYVDGAGVPAIARQMMGLEEDPEDEVAADMLRRLWSQAASSTAASDDFAGVSLVVGTPEVAEVDAGIGAWDVRSDAGVLATVALAGRTTASAAAAGPVPEGAAPPSVERAANQGNLAALLDIDLPLVVRFARTELSLRALTMLGPGSMLDMGRSPDDPVQLLVGSQVIAEGEVVVVGGNYGVRITSLVSPAERLKAMDL